MSVNNVFIGDLANADGNDCLSFDGVDDNAYILNCLQSGDSLHLRDTAKTIRFN